MESSKTLIYFSSANEEERCIANVLSSLNAVCFINYFYNVAFLLPAFIIFNYYLNFFLNINMEPVYARDKYC